MVIAFHQQQAAQVAEAHPPAEQLPQSQLPLDHSGNYSSISLEPGATTAIAFKKYVGCSTPIPGSPQQWRCGSFGFRPRLAAGLPP
mmetsp:Transcript_45970/g.98263  ORF Transcript_45970/g.98263 Transcript_45970/m.98263 type:complete len:86 (+) Transcript_45970:1182-1439(+)